MTRRIKYLPQQYEATAGLSINHNYLVEQFADFSDIFAELEGLVRQGDYTLGAAVERFEANICALTGSRFALGVGSGTDALLLSLKALDVGPGDEVITTPYTFYATVGAIVTAGARPVFVDVRADYNIDPNAIEAAVTPNTKAVMPVHWSGQPCAMDDIIEIARRRDLQVVEDACHCIQAEYRGRAVGRHGDAGCFSMHPLKNLNVWGDGGYVITDSAELHQRLALLRNHGLENRDRCVRFAYNSRLDTLQAIVANHLLPKLDHITKSRIENARRYDELLATVPQITLPPRSADTKHVYHLYVVRAERRDELKQYLVDRDVDAKVHYPVPMHLQPAASHLGYRKGSFLMCEAICSSVLSLPVHEFITERDIDYVVDQVRAFYHGG